MFTKPIFAKRFSFETLLGKLGRRRQVHLRAGSGWRLFNSRRAALGVELRGSSLHLAIARPGWGRRWILATSTIPDYAQLTAEQLGEKLREFLLPLRGEEPVVVLGMSRGDAVVRLCSLPQMGKQALDEALQLQAEMYRPAEEQSFCWDAATVPHGESLAASLVFVPRPQVERLAALFAAAGFPLSLITLSQFAMLQMAFQGRPEGTSSRFVLIDVAASNVELSLIENGQLVYSRGFAPPAGEVAIEDGLLAEIRQAFSALRWKQDGAIRVLLAGAAAETTEVALGELGRVSRMKDWLQTDAVSGARETERWGAISLAVAGLGRRGAYRVNLLPPELRTVKHRWQRGLTYALIGANALVLAALFLHEPVQRQLLLREYRQDTARVLKSSQETQQILDNQKKMLEYLQQLGDFQSHGHQSLDALAEMGQRLPADTWLNNFAYRKGQVEILGTAKSASALVPLLEASPQFTNLKFGGALTRDASGAERFRLQMGVKSQP
jgi:Tfp pilus assembly protein PilN